MLNEREPSKRILEEEHANASLELKGYENILSHLQLQDIFSITPRLHHPRNGVKKAVPAGHQDHSNSCAQIREWAAAMAFPNKEHDMQTPHVDLSNVQPQRLAAVFEFLTRAAYIILVQNGMTDHQAIQRAPG